MHNMHLPFAIRHVWLGIWRAVTDAPCYCCGEQDGPSILRPKEAHFTALDPPKGGTYIADDFG
jgi:hypothetical protein